MRLVAALARRNAPLPSASTLATLQAGLGLGLRYVQARCLSVWGLVVAALLCEPHDFADFAIYSCLVNGAGIAVLLRYEGAFVQDDDPVRLRRALRLATAAGGASLGLAGVAASAGVALGWFSGLTAVLFLVSVAGRAVLRLTQAEAAAEGDLTALGNNGLLHALVQPIVMILLMLGFGASAAALFAADAIGHAVAAWAIARQRRRALGEALRPEAWTTAEIVESARQWSHLPRVQLPSVVLSYGFTLTPLFVVATAASPLFAAQVGLAMRLLDMPTQIFSATAAPLGIWALRNRQGPARRHWIGRATLGLVAAAAVLFGTVAGGSLLVDPWLTGTAWAGLGLTMGTLCLFYGGVALVGPLQEINSVSAEQGRQMIVNAAGLALACGLLALSGGSGRGLLAVLGLVSLMRTAAHLHIARRIGRPERQQALATA